MGKAAPCSRPSRLVSHPPTTRQTGSAASPSRTKARWSQMNRPLRSPLPMTEPKGLVAPRDPRPGPPDKPCRSASPRTRASHARRGRGECLVRGLARHGGRSWCNSSSQPPSIARIAPHAGCQALSRSNARKDPSRAPSLSANSEVPGSSSRFSRHAYALNAKAWHPDTSGTSNMDPVNSGRRNPFAQPPVPPPRRLCAD